MGRFSKILGSLVLLNFIGIQKCFAEPSPGWSGVNHGHGHGWMKVHSNKHHEHSSKLSEAYVKFHGLGGGGNGGKGGSSSGGGKGGILGNIFGGGGSGSSAEGWSAPVTTGQEIMGVHMGGPQGGGGGGGGWGMMMMPQASSMGGWGQGGGGGGAKPTGWASSQGSPSGGQQMQQAPTGWQAGDFSRFKPSAGSTDKHYSFELPSGKPAWIQKLKPLIDLPKLSLKGWGWRK